MMGSAISVQIYGDDLGELAKIASEVGGNCRKC